MRSIDKKVKLFPIITTPKSILTNKTMLIKSEMMKQKTISPLKVNNNILIEDHTSFPKQQLSTKNQINLKLNSIQSNTKKYSLINTKSNLLNNNQNDMNNISYYENLNTINTNTNTNTYSNSIDDSNYNNKLNNNENYDRTKKISIIDSPYKTHSISNIKTKENEKSTKKLKLLCKEEEDSKHFSIEDPSPSLKPSLVLNSKLKLLKKKSSLKIRLSSNSQSKSSNDKKTMMSIENSKSKNNVLYSRNTNNIQRNLTIVNNEYSNSISKTRNKFRSRKSKLKSCISYTARKANFNFFRVYPYNSLLRKSVSHENYKLNIKKIFKKYITYGTANLKKKIKRNASLLRVNNNISYFNSQVEENVFFDNDDQQRLESNHNLNDSLNRYRNNQSKNVFESNDDKSVDSQDNYKERLKKNEKRPSNLLSIDEETVRLTNQIPYFDKPKIEIDSNFLQLIIEKRKELLRNTYKHIENEVIKGMTIQNKEKRVIKKEDKGNGKGKLIELFKLKFKKDIFEPLVFTLDKKFFIQSFNQSKVKLMKRQIMNFSKKYLMEENFILNEEHSNDKVFYWKCKLIKKKLKINSKFSLLLNFHKDYGYFKIEERPFIDRKTNNKSHMKSENIIRLNSNFSNKIPVHKKIIELCSINKEELSSIKKKNMNIYDKFNISPQKNSIFKIKDKSNTIISLNNQFPHGFNLDFIRKSQDNMEKDKEKEKTNNTKTTNNNYNNSVFNIFNNKLLLKNNSFSIIKKKREKNIVISNTNHHRKQITNSYFNKINTLSKEDDVEQENSLLSSNKSTSNYEETQLKFDLKNDKNMFHILKMSERDVTNQFKKETNTNTVVPGLRNEYMISKYVTRIKSFKEVFTNKNEKSKNFNSIINKDDVKKRKNQNKTIYKSENTIQNDELCLSFRNSFIKAYLGKYNTNNNKNNQLETIKNLKLTEFNRIEKERKEKESLLKKLNYNENNILTLSPNLKRSILNTLKSFIIDNNFVKFKDLTSKINLSEYDVNKMLLLSTYYDTEMITKYLIKLGGNVNSVETSTLNTPLHYALFNKNFALANFLISKGAVEKNLNANEQNAWQMYHSKKRILDK